MYENMYYPPFYGGSTGYQNPMMMQQQPQQMQPQQPQTGITVAQVPTIEQVEQVQLSPGDKKIILVQNAPVIAIRIADQMGLVSTEYRRTEVFDPKAQQPSQEYVPMEVFQSQMAAVINELNEIKGGLSNNAKPVKQSNAASAASK